MLRISEQGLEGLLALGFFALVLLFLSLALAEKRLPQDPPWRGFFFAA